MSEKKTDLSSTGMTRRNFLAGAGAAVAAGAIAGVVPAAVAAEQPALDKYIDADDTVYGHNRLINMENVNPIPTLSEPAKYDYETEVLLIGFGVSATSAGLTLANNGVSFIAMEKTPEENWYEHGGLHGVLMPGHKQWLKKMGIPGWNREIIASMLQPHLSNADKEAEITLELEAVKALEQIEALGPGCQFELVPAFDAPWAQGMPTMFPTNDNIEGGNVYHPWVNKYHAIEHCIKRVIIDQKGNKVLWGTPASNLIADSTGAVVGAKGVTIDGTEVYVKAKATIICTNGYGANYDMVQYYGLLDEMCGCHVGPLLHTGDGMRMAQGAGCGLRTLPRWVTAATNGGIDAAKHGLPWTMVHTPYPEGFEGRQLSFYTNAAIQLAREPFLKVNKFAQRFEDEEAEWYPRLWTEFHQPEHRVFVLYDSDVESMAVKLNEKRYGVCERLIYPELHVYFNDDDIRPMWKWQDQMQQAIDNGFIFKCDTIEELAGKLGLDATALQATVDHYNELCDAGVDTDYGKVADWLYPVRKAPFYGMERTPAFLWQANGGIAVNTKGEVLKKDGTVIPGLYGGGLDASMSDAAGYSDPNGSYLGVTGGSQFAIGMGYIAANSVAEALKA